MQFSTFIYTCISKSRRLFVSKAKIQNNNYYHTASIPPSWCSQQWSFEAGRTSLGTKIHCNLEYQEKDHIDASNMIDLNSPIMISMSWMGLGSYKHKIEDQWQHNQVHGYPRSYLPSMPVLQYAWQHIIKLNAQLMISALSFGFLYLSSKWQRNIVQQCATSYMSAKNLLPSPS